MSTVTTSEVEKVIEMALINTAEHVRASQSATFELVVCEFKKKKKKKKKNQIQNQSEFESLF
jgi:hypothetical protein